MSRQPSVNMATQLQSLIEAIQVKKIKCDFLGINFYEVELQPCMIIEWVIDLFTSALAVYFCSPFLDSLRDRFSLMILILEDDHPRRELGDGGCEDARGPGAGRNGRQDEPMVPPSLPRWRFSDHADYCLLWVRRHHPAAGFCV